ncbi:hypothetical protein BsWGS_14843 [Bradybaena similaris]
MGEPRRSCTSRGEKCNKHGKTTAPLQKSRWGGVQQTWKNYGACVQVEVRGATNMENYGACVQVEVRGAANVEKLRRLCTSRGEGCGKQGKTTAPVKSKFAPTFIASQISKQSSSVNMGSR